jgi:nitroimidazol reductase NimA-like FMN-containing flavoprotein (pyridoxamine 5'-phosphate oxidase superfamily)
MATLTEKQLEYLRSQRLARIATADSHGQPHVVPVGFRVSADATAIEHEISLGADHTRANRGLGYRLN